MAQRPTARRTRQHRRAALVPSMRVSRRSSFEVCVVWRGGLGRRRWLAGNVRRVSEDSGTVPRRVEFPVHWAITSRWSDNDAYGHVNNVVHYSWFDTAVNGWLMSAVGTDIRQLPAIGVVAETNCRYLSELSFPDEITVGLAVARLGKSSVTYSLAVFGNDADEPASVGRFVHVYVDQQARRPVPIPTEIRSVLEGIRTV